MSVTPNRPELLVPEWSLPPGVRALLTTRTGGVSQGPWASLNLGDGSGDEPAAVIENRRRLRRAAKLPGEPLWLRQVHGRHVVRAAAHHPGIEADGCLTERPGQVCVVLTADCLPLLLCDEDGSEVAAVHAGWRGLAAGIVPWAVTAFRAPPVRLLAWLGPAICQQHYEVGEQLCRRFASLIGEGPWYRPGRPGHGWLDLKAIARAQLRRAGVERITDSGLCTACDPRRFWSHRHQAPCGRFASLIWREPG